MLSFGGIWYILHLFPLVIIMAVTVLELGIAALQAYPNCPCGFTKSKL